MGTYLRLENLNLSCNAAVDSYIDCQKVIPWLKNVIIRTGNNATCGIHTQPKANGLAPILDRVDVRYVKGSALYVGQDWLCIPTIFSCYQTNQTEATHPMVQIGGTSPITFYAASTVYGGDIGTLHLFTPAANPNNALEIQAQATIDVLDFEGVTANTSLIYTHGGPLHIGQIFRGTAPKMINNHASAQHVSISQYYGVKIADKIDLTNPAAWTAVTPGEVLCAYCYIPNETTLPSGITTYDLYNKWTCNGYTKIRIYPQTTLPTGIHVKGVYDRDATTTNQLRIVIDNTTGAGFELTEDAVFWLKLC